jgi:hypothetical protein
MFVIISVGHKVGLAVIPAAMIDTARVQNEALKSLSMRLNMMVKGRVTNFDYSLFGHKIERVEETSPCADVVHTILSVVEHAEFLRYDHIAFTLVRDLPTLVLETETRYEEMRGKLQQLTNAGLDKDGTSTCMRQELLRMQAVVERAKLAIDQPEIIW